MEKNIKNYDSPALTRTLTDQQELALMEMKSRALAKRLTRKDFKKEEAFPLQMNTLNRCPYCECTNADILEVHPDECYPTSGTFVCEDCKKVYWYSTEQITVYSAHGIAL